jgi:hypothetical protein
MPSLNQNSRQQLGQQPEIIAVVLPDGTPESPSALRDFVATGTMLLVRHADGRMALEPARNSAAWVGQAGAQRTVSKSRPILDPISREVMGYEMEMVDHSLAS